MSSTHRISLFNLLGLLAFGVLFGVISAVVRANEVYISSTMHGGGIVSAISFITLTAVFVIFVIPLDIIFLIPIGSTVWGPVPTAFMSIIGWTIGATIAFCIARYMGANVVRLIIGLDRVNAFEKRIPTQNLFWGVVLLRLFVSVDILSYGLGIFSKMPLVQYIVATGLGVTPFGFYFAYAGVLTFWYQIFAIMGAVTISAVVMIKYGLFKEY